MAEETDGLEEAIEGQLRVLVTTASQVGERLAREREQELRKSQAREEAAQRELRARFEAERRAARVELADAHRPEWWERATPEDIGRVYQVARAWSQEDPEAARAEERMRHEMRQRYGIEVTDSGQASEAAGQRWIMEVNQARREQGLGEPQREHRAFEDAYVWARTFAPEHASQFNERYTDLTDPRQQEELRSQFVHDVWKTFHERAGQEQRALSAEEHAQAQRLVTEANQEEQRAAEASAEAAHEPDAGEREHAESEAERREAAADTAREDGATMYDSAERREGTAQELEAKGIAPQVVATRMHADVSQARPAREAVRVGATARAPRMRMRRARGRMTQRSGLAR